MQFIGHDVSQLKFPRGKKDDRGRYGLAIEMDAGEKCAIRGRKEAELSVFELKISPAIGTYRVGAAAADRAEPTVAMRSTHPRKIRLIAV